jgi:Bacterial extracellular solute-binding proteins, family 5 Middle
VEPRQPKRGGILRVRGGDPAHFDPHLTVNNYTNNVLSFVYSRLVWSLPIDRLGAGAKYYQYDPQEARRLLAEAGYPQGLKTQLTVSGGLGCDLVDDAQLVQRYLKDVGIEAELKIQEHGAYMATTTQGKFEGLVDGPTGTSWELDSPLYHDYASDSSWTMTPPHGHAEGTTAHEGLGGA